MDIDLKTLAERVGGRLDGPADLRVHGLAGIRDASAGHCTFVAAPKYLPALETTKASAVLLAEGVDCALPCVRVADPALAFARALEIFAPTREELFPGGVDERASVAPDARLGTNVHVGPFAVIGAGCRVGDGSIVGAGTVLMAGVEVGVEALLYPRVVIREFCRLGDRVIVHAGAVVGADGFGFGRDGATVVKIPQIGRVVLEDDVEIGANVCIDRATTGETVIGAQTKIDNLVQIAHNVRVGERTAISAQSGVSGSSTLGDDCILAGQVGIADHLVIGHRVRIGAKSGVSNGIEDDAAVSGIPTRRHQDWKRMQVHLTRLSQYADRIARLEKRVEELENP